MAVKFWVAPATATVRGSGIGVAPLNKQVAPPGEIDETDRVSIGQADNLWRLRAWPGSVGVEHGGITKVTLHGRIYMSNNGPFVWDFSTNDAYVAPYVVVDGVATYFTPDWVNVPYQLYVGQGYQNGWNFNQQGQPTSFKIGPAHVGWDVTALAAWTNAKLAACEFGLSMDEASLGTYYRAGYMPINGPAGTTPRYNISQLILEVDAADPPPSYAKSFMAVIA